MKETSENNVEHISIPLSYSLAEDGKGVYG
jgi:hypothetical protein